MLSASVPLPVKTISPGSAPSSSGHLAPRRLDRLAGLASFLVQARRIAPEAVQVRLDRLQHARVQRRRGGVVEVDAARASLTLRDKTSDSPAPAPRRSAIASRSPSCRRKSCRCRPADCRGGTAARSTSGVSRTSATSGSMPMPCRALTSRTRTFGATSWIRAETPPARPAKRGRSWSPRPRRPARASARPSAAGSCRWWLRAPPAPVRRRRRASTAGRGPAVSTSNVSQPFCSAQRRPSPSTITLQWSGQSSPE